jgi:hypothetical protein
LCNVTAITRRLVVRVIAGNEVRVVALVAGGDIVVFARDPNQAAETRWAYGGVRGDGEKGFLLLIVAFEAMEKGEEDMVRRMGIGGGMMDRYELGRRESADGSMWGRTGEEDRERGEKIWGIIEAVYDIVLGGGDGRRAHVWWIVMMLWERKAWVVVWFRVK